MTWDEIYSDWYHLLGVDKLRAKADVAGQLAIDDPSFENREAYGEALAKLRFAENDATRRTEATANMVWRASRLASR
jgi:hypothetical protein